MSTYAIGGFGAADAFDAMCYGESHPSTVQYLAQQVSHVAETLTDAGRAFMAGARDLFDHYHGSEAMRFARGVLAKVKGAVQNQRIHSIWETVDFQNASLAMQRWIMANPTVRELYHKQRCDGYSDTYVDMEPGQVKHDHYDYRRVMDGVMLFEPDEETDWKVYQYLDELKEGDRDLEHFEKVDIQNTWNAMDMLLAIAKDDPTSAVGGSL